MICPGLVEFLDLFGFKEGGICLSVSHELMHRIVVETELYGIRGDVVEILN